MKVGIHNVLPGMLGMRWRKHAAIDPDFIKADDV